MRAYESALFRQENAIAVIILQRVLAGRPRPQFQRPPLKCLHTSRLFTARLFSLRLSKRKIKQRLCTGYTRADLSFFYKQYCSWFH